MNNIFQKNVAALATKNPELAQRLLSYIPLEMPKLVQENGAYNLLYKDVFVHNKQNPLAEAQEIFSMAKNEPVSIHLIYGCGLGYLFQIFSANSRGTVILYEPDLNILWTTFTLVDFTNDIMKKNVYIVDTFEALSQEVYKKSGMKNSPELLSLPSQREYNSEGFKELVEKLKEMVGAFFLDLKFTKEKFFPALKMLCRNIPNLVNEVPLVVLKDLYKGKTAVIVSAGPTLDRNIETLKNNREKYVLFVVGTAVKILYKHGLKPDFLCIIETYNSSKQVEGLDLSDVNLITEPYSNPVIREFKYKRVFSHISDNVPLNTLWKNISGIETEEYLSKGTVSYTALNSARLLGFSKIIFVGQDLAYIDGQCYSKDSVYKDLYCGYNSETKNWEIMAKDFEAFANAINPNEDAEKRRKIAHQRLMNLNASLYMAKGINGEMIPTESVYSAFVKPLSEYTTKYNDRVYINTSLVGLQIDGYENMPLEQALEGSEKIENIHYEIENLYDKEFIVKNLLGVKEELQEVCKKIEEGNNYIRSINNDLKRHREVNVDILKMLKKLSMNYIDISSEFSEKCLFFDLMMSAQKIDLDYEMKMVKNFDIETVNRIVEFLTVYYIKGRDRSKGMQGFIDKAIEGLK